MSNQKQKIEDYIQENDNNLKIIKASINKFLKGLSEGNIKVHHIVKVANGNNDTHYDLDNLIYVCTSCHRAIEGMNAEEIFEYISFHL